MSALSDHLLRTLAAIPPRSRVLDLRGTHTDALVRLGFEVHGADAPVFPQLAYPDAHFDWIVAVRPFRGADAAGQAALLREARRVLAPGGWMYVAVPSASDHSSSAGGFTEEALGALMAAADWAEAQAPRLIEEEQAALVQAIYRRVEADTPT